MNRVRDAISWAVMCILLAPACGAPPAEPSDGGTDAGTPPGSCPNDGSLLALDTEQQFTLSATEPVARFSLCAPTSGFFEIAVRCKPLDDPAAVDVGVAGAGASEALLSLAAMAGGRLGYVPTEAFENYDLTLSLAEGDACEVFLRAMWLPQEDAWEPNDLLEEAAPIELGQEVAGQLFAGYRGSQPPTLQAFEDWYVVRLPEGAVRVAFVKDINPDAIMAPTVLDEDGHEIPELSHTSAGTYHYVISQAGTHFIRVRPAFGQDDVGASWYPPSWFNSGYTLTVSGE